MARRSLTAQAIPGQASTLIPQPAAVSAPTEAADQKPLSQGYLAGLGIHGMGSIEPLVLGALAAEVPLLLIGAHGTAKSLLLVRAAEALGLDWRHYNASLVNFDDLIGFPLPGPNGSLDYVRTPAAIWGAGAVIFDEISRCRPDVQNKIFPIVHERRAQGLLLEDLRHRWAAMNPPAGDGVEDNYLGSEPLDAALADRFAFILRMPSWASLSEAEQLAALSASPDATPSPTARAAFAEAVAATRRALPAVASGFGDKLANYVRTLMGLLEQAGLPISPRRGGILVRNIIAVHAAALIANPRALPADAAWTSLLAGLPQRAQGITIPEGKLLAAHRQAWHLAGIAPNDPLRCLIAEADPVRRVALATAAHKIPKAEFSGLIADAFARAAPGARAAIAVHLFETCTVGRLSAAVAEQIGALYRCIGASPDFVDRLSAHSDRYKAWKQLRDHLSRLDPASAEHQLGANALVQAFKDFEINRPADVDTVWAAWTEARQVLAGGAP